MCEFSIKPDESCRRHRRDGTRSDCILLYKEGDVGQLSRLMITPPARKLSKKDEALLDEVRAVGLLSLSRFLFTVFPRPSDARVLHQLDGMPAQAVPGQVHGHEQ